jgi:putative flippase GtrA
VANTQANRRWTFGLRGRERLLRQHAAGAIVFVLTLAVTSGALLALHALVQHPTRWLELTVLVAASVTATVTRYLGLRFWVFTQRPPTLARCEESELRWPYWQSP